MRIEKVIAKACGTRQQFDKKEEIFSWIKCIVLAVAITLLLVNFVFLFVRVDGESMTNTLQNNDRLFVDRLVYTFSEPRRGDIVICHFPKPDIPFFNYQKDKTYVKRCVAVAGDTVEIKDDGYLYVNDELVTESYIITKSSISGGDRTMKNTFAKTTVPEGCIFVMGDNRDDSTDSRVVGAVPLDLVLGKACFVIWPISNWEYIG